MLRLFIETSNLDFQIALHDGETFLYRSDNSGQNAPRDLTTLLEDGLNQTGRTAAELAEIIVDIGPGGLTSTRSGIAFANGLAFALNIRIVEANGLELMMLQTQRDQQEHVIAARRSNDGNYFLGFYHDAHCHRLALGKPQELIAELGWQDQRLAWIGPAPKPWAEDPPPFEVEFIDLMSPGLGAFEILLRQTGFADRPRKDAAGPINELIRLNEQ
ncbi:MAG: tRNA (adenosine(37)-N6)-threonylcarbamoyltransferase complex dimerization subunit type 1 TsaB [Rhizobiaceae bacterium]